MTNSTRQETGLIRNNTLSVREIAGRKLLPGATDRFTRAELQPYAGNPAFRHAFVINDLQEIPENVPPPLDFLQIRETAPQVPAKPDVNKLGEGSPIRVDTAEGKAALAKFLQEGTTPSPAPAPVKPPENAPASEPAPVTPPPQS